MLLPDFHAESLAPGEAINWVLLISSMGTVALGEVMVCYVLGLPLLKLLPACLRRPGRAGESKLK